MSRSKKKTTDELEQLKEENRELKSINKSLERQLKKLSKELKIEFNQDDLIEEELDSKINKCTKCNRGVIKQTALGPRVLITCTICTYNKVIKNAT